VPLPVIERSTRLKLNPRAMNEQSIENVFAATKVDSSHSSSFVAVGQKAVPTSVHDDVIRLCRARFETAGHWHKLSVERTSNSTSSDGMSGSCLLSRPTLVLTR
jgi:hypothetical protein